jgi:CubicO group peptidase (beta-lactamase class C family)
MLLLQQADQGLVAPDDHVSKYVKGLVNSNAATLRILANITSCMASYKFMMVNGFTSQYRRQLKARDSIHRQQYQLF